MSEKRKKIRIALLLGDVMGILQLQKSASYALMSKIKLFLNKKRHQYISLREFSEYTGIPFEDIESFINFNP